MGKTLTVEDRAFMHGFAIAMADFDRMFDNPTAVREVLENAGFSIAGLKRAGVEEYDLKQLRKAFW